MLCQTVQTIMPLLQLLQQPAFCIQNDGAFVANPAASHLLPVGEPDLTRLFGVGMQHWKAWDRTTILNLPMTILEQEYNASIEALQDGTLFLLAPDSPSDHTDNALSAASQVLRQPLADLSAMLQHFSEHHNKPQSPDYTAMMTRQIYRLTRLTSNLADLAELRSGKYRLRPELLDVNQHFGNFMQEVEQLCTQAGRVLDYTPLAKSIFLQADPALLERAILNLVSNALKFSRKESPIRIRAEVSGSYLLFRVQSQCAGESAELLRAAFTRLEQRGSLPDPNWGIGLGLPICQAIARLHGGMVAVEAAQSGSITVTLTLSRNRASSAAVLDAPPPFAYTGGMRRTLVELADVLPNNLYWHDAL